LGSGLESDDLASDLAARSDRSPTILVTNCRLH
jgi:hypothetical protein